MNFLDWKDRQSSGQASLPIPPAKLRNRVHGSLRKNSFLEVGTDVATNLKELCQIAGKDLYSFEKILDFGCGSGRVIRNFLDAPKTCKLFGTDIDPELVQWCKANLPQIEWNVNGYQPPLPYPENTFDLIYGISVFTHLDEAFQNAWLAELLRVAKPGGLLILTIHGEHNIGMLSVEQQKQTHANGFLYVTGATGLLKLDGLPDFYQNAYHTKSYIQREWSKYFEIIQHVEQGVNHNQDAILLRKR